MNDPRSFWDAVEEIRQRDGRFRADAYAFVMDVLEFTIRGLDVRRHVSAAELLDGMRRFAHERYGVMSLTVLESWGVHTTGDIGDIVFQLVDAGVLSRQDGDARDHFEDVFDLPAVLEQDYFGDQASSQDV